MQKKLLALVSILSLGLAVTLCAQVSPSTGAIQGTVVDASGAVLPGATVTLTNPLLSINRQTKTQGDGTYLFPLVQPSSGYQVLVEAAGFQRQSLPDLTVRVTEITVANAKLVVGATSEEIVVRGDAAAVQTTNAALGGVVNREVLVALPLPTRSVFDLLATDAGVGATLTSPANTITQSQQALFVAGSRATANNYILNGIDANNFEFHTLAAGIVPIPDPDAVQEFRTQTNLYDATSGYGSGGNITLITRAGTSKIHGGVYEFYRDSIFNAGDFFLNRNGVKKPFFLQNQYGFSLGGPMPKFLPKTFWFVNYEALRQKNGIQGSVTGRIPVLPDNRTAANLAAAFGLPVTAIDPVAVKLLNAPGPYEGHLIPSGRNAAPGHLGDYGFSSPVRYNSDEFNARLDHDFETGFGPNHFSGTLFWSSGALLSPSGANNALGQAYQYLLANNSVSLNDTHIFRPNLLNEFAIGTTWNERDISSVNNLNIGDVGISRFNSGLITDLPSFSFADQLNCCGATVSINQTQHNASYDTRDMVSYVRSKHTFRMGFEMRRSEFNINPSLSRGSFFFSNFIADQQYGLPAGVDDLSFRDFLVGAPSSISIGSGLHSFAYRAHDYIGFIQDDYRVSRRLTLNLGLRYDYLGPVFENHNEIANFDPSLLSPDAIQFGGPGLKAGLIAPAGAKNAGTPGVSPSTLVDEKNAHFAPRFGFAYDIFGNGKLAIRGGYGMYYSRIAGASAYQTAFGPPFNISVGVSNTSGTQLLSNAFPVLPLPDAFPLYPKFPTLTGITATGAPIYDGPTLSMTVLDRTMRSPYTESWNLTLQNEFLPGWTVETGYLGTHGLHLIAGQSINNALLRNSNDPARFGIVTNSSANRESRVPVAGFSSGGLFSITDGGKSFYDAFLLTVNHRFSKGFYFKGAYTFSKTIDNASSSSGFEISGTSPGNQFFPDLNKGLADYDIRHRFVMTYVYEIPHPRVRYLNQIIGGWALGGITTMQSGFPGTILQSIGNTTLSGTSGYGVVLPNCQLMTGGDPKDHLNNYLNTACVSTMPLLTAGSTITGLTPYESPGSQTYTIDTGGGRLQGPVTRGFFRQPFQKRWDVTASKKFTLPRLGEQTNLEFRAEFFKIFNNPIFSSANGTAGSPTFGRITATIDNTGRQMQFALKLNF